MATLLSEVIKLIIASVIMFGLSSFLLVSAHESHEHDQHVTGFAVSAIAHELESPLVSDAVVSVAESIHGHSHDGFSHDHTGELVGQQIIQIRNMPLAKAPDDFVSSIYAPPVFEIDIPPRS